MMVATMLVIVVERFEELLTEGDGDRIGVRCLPVQEAHVGHEGVVHALQAGAASTTHEAGVESRQVEHGHEQSG